MTDEFTPLETGFTSETLERDMSGFPVSIGTGLALETLFQPVMDVIDPERKVDQVANLKRYDAYIFNVDTLIRNLLSSLDRTVLDTVKPVDVYITIAQEIAWISNFFMHEHGLDVRFFINSYSYYKKEYKDSFRIPATPKQIREEKLHEFCRSHLLKNPPIRKGIDKFKQVIKYDDLKSILLLSHVPADLLSFKYFRVLDLLESHTGKVKTRKDYNSKYYPLPSEDMSFLPFYEYGLVVFGDKHMFKPKPMKERKEYYNSLKRMGVNPFTSEYALLSRI